MRYQTAAVAIPQTTIPGPLPGPIDLSLPTGGPSASPANRTDRFDTYGGGLHYLFSDTIRFGVGIDRSARHSGLTLRGYESTRVVAQFGYGP
jgi:hypothetical protein